jgi:hypothetical protein
MSIVLPILAIFAKSVIIGILLGSAVTIAIIILFWGLGVFR